MPKHSRALETWREKLDNLLEQEAKEADPNRRFQLEKDIAEAKGKIVELDDNSKEVVNVTISEPPARPPADPPSHGQPYMPKERARLVQIPTHKKRLQVFISSTYVDLLEERQAAVAAILTAGHIPAGMELFTAGDETQMDVIKRWIDESDVFMLILGSRYGSIEPATGKSYTHIEYDYAVANGKPVFATVLNDGALDERVRRMGATVVENQDPKALREFRKQVCKRMVRFWTEPKDIQLTVHETMTEFAKREDLRGWVRASDDIAARPLTGNDSSGLKTVKEAVASVEFAAGSRNGAVVDVLSCDTDGSFEVIDALCRLVNRGSLYTVMGYSLTLKNLTGSPLKCKVTLQFQARDGTGIGKGSDSPPGTIQAHAIGPIGGNIDGIKNAKADQIAQVVIDIRKR